MTTNSPAADGSRRNRLVEGALGFLAHVELADQVGPGEEREHRHAAHGSDAVGSAYDGTALVSDAAAEPVFRAGRTSPEQAQADLAMARDRRSADAVGASPLRMLPAFGDLAGAMSGEVPPRSRRFTRSA
jgi:hypothetical protein